MVVNVGDIFKTRITTPLAREVRAPYYGRSMEVRAWVELLTARCKLIKEEVERPRSE